MGDRTITYSPAYTLVPTYECFNRCSYCNFRAEPESSPWLSLPEAGRILTSLQAQGVCEILILSGEVHPRSPRRAAWIDHLYQLGKLALERGFLPHTNAGILSLGEMAWLQQVNVSMGLMLEQLTPSLQQTVHRHAPSKAPALRLAQLEQAGELGIPFTTGLLLGIGESDTDRRETLAAIAAIHRRWGHIQEVILQPYSLGQQQLGRDSSFEIAQLPQVVALARAILPDAIALQIPPNLIPGFQILWDCLEAGATDLGGIGPKDEVNPDYPHPHDRQLARTLARRNWKLIPRLPVYPHLCDRLPLPLRPPVQSWEQKMLRIVNNAKIVG
jgi:FO synthase subunit 1